MSARTDGIRTSARPLGRLAAKWLQVLDGLDERARTRVIRGRTLARGGRVRELEIAPGMALGEVLDGAVQRPTLRLRTFEEDDWAKVLDVLSHRLDLLARLLEGEVADELLAALAARGVPLLPCASELDGDCDCGDWAIPCPHGAALHHVLGDALDGEPFLLFALRGRPREQLLAELRRGWGDTGLRTAVHGPSDEPVPDGDPFTCPTPLPPMSFRFRVEPPEGEGGPVPPGMLELGPLAGDDDLVRSLQPLYDAGASYAREVALAEGPGRKRRARPNVSAREYDELTERIVDVLADSADGATAEELARDLDTEADLVVQELEELGVLGIVVRSDFAGDDVRFWLG